MHSRLTTALAASAFLLAAAAQARTYHCAESDPSRPRELAPSSRADAEPSPPETITIAMVPDVQYYTECRLPHLAQQMRWIADSAAGRNIRAALFMGDLTEHNTPDEWSFFREQVALAQDRVPLMLATGNHDEGRNGATHSRSTGLVKFFPEAPGIARSSLAERRKPGSIENAYYRITLPRVTLGVLVLEWAPRTSTVRWANRVLSRYADDRVIVVTHAYLYDDSTRYDWRKRGEDQMWNPLSFELAWGESTHDPENDGEMLWSSLIRRHRGVFLVLCGHVGGTGTGRLESRGDAGNVVEQVLANFQTLDEGGLGYLRLLEIQPDGRSIRMKTYSPSLGSYATSDAQRAEWSIVPALW